MLRLRENISKNTEHQFLQLDAGGQLRLDDVNATAQGRLLLLKVFMERVAQQLLQYFQ